MSVMRDVLLWASRNETLKRQVPRWGFVKRALRQFMPGERLEDALETATMLAGKGVASMFTKLGENLTEPAQADAVVEHYLGAYERIAALGLDTEISVKPTQLGLDLDPEHAARGLETLAAKAEEMGNWLWIDMESSEYVQPTIDLYRRVKDKHFPVGVCLQAYLWRTPQDIADLIPLQPGIRLVKGAYKEPASQAITRRAEIDEAFFRQGADLLIADGVRLALATHDVALLNRLEVVAQAAGRARDSYEIQMLFGIRMEDQYRYAAEGYAMRDLTAYGDQWYPWYLRRLAERPANLAFVARNVFARD
ncbi:MAG: proline dehydrogenase family protein [Acidimicrobiia bacterium]|nr:proline dehydrogenase family protein [Acidimicrobiia bacterium]